MINKINKIQFSKKHLFVYLPVLLSGIIIWYALRFGIGVSPDSTFYISAAKSFKETGEYRDIWRGAYLDYMTHYPPGYSFFVFLFSYFFDDFFVATKYLNIVLFSILICILGFYLKKYLSLFTLGFLLVFVIFSLSFLNIYEMAWSECLFLPLSFLGLFMFNNYLTTSKVKWLLLSAILIAFSVFTRYIGITLIITITLFLLFSKAKFIKKIFHLFIFNLIANSLFYYWLVRNILLTDNAASRDVSYHPMGVEYYMDLVKSIKEFFLQFRTTTLIEIIIGSILFLLIIVYFFSLLSREKTKLNSFKILLVSYFFITLFFLFLSNTFFDLTPLYYRIIIPALFGVLIALVIEFDGKVKGKARLILVGLFVVHVVTAVGFIINKTDGRDYNNEVYKNVSTNQFINELDFNKNIIFTNEVDRVYYLTNKIGYWIKDYPNFKMDKRYKVLINYKNGRRFDDSQEIILKEKYVLLKETEDALIYGI